MRALTWSFCAVFTLPCFASFACLACSSGGSASGGGEDAAAGPVLSGSPDAGTFTFIDDAAVEAGPLLATCNPSVPNSCTTGFLCYPDHTSTSWWTDLYGTCTFDCNNQTYALCDSLGGVCGCPVAADASSADCSLDGGEAMVCVPAVKPGTAPGASEGDGGCGTPGCGGGTQFDSGSGAGEDAGISEAGEE